MHIDSIYQTTAQAEQFVQTAGLRAVEWKLLISIAQMKGFTVRQIARELSIGEEASEKGIRRLLELSLIHDPEITWNHFATLFPSLVPQPEPVLPKNGSAEMAPVRLTIKRAVHPNAQRNASSAEPLRLKPILDFIRQRSGGGSLGQMAVYRVFLKISPELLKRSGMDTVNLDDDILVVEDPALTIELLQAVREVVGEAYNGS